MIWLRRLLILGVLAWTLPCAGAGFPVFDGANYFANLATQINTLKQTINDGVMIANQAKALEYQVASLYNEALNLKANPLQLLGQLQGLWSGYNGLMANAEGLAFGVQQTQARFETAYPALATGSVQEITARSVAMLKSIRAASATAVTSQSIYERLCQQLALSQQAITAAQASTGALQIAHAQAQIQALGNEQLATIAQIEAASGRVQTEWIAMQVKEREDATVVHSTFLDGYGAQGFKPIGQQP